jgi:anti-sigma factor RsiW
MSRGKLPKHPNDEALLAYLDGEMSGSRIRRIRNHLKSCWKCRSVLADLESQAEIISRLLSAQRDSDTDRSIKATEKFLRWRTSFERGRKSFFGTQRSLLGDLVRVALAQ